MVCVVYDVYVVQGLREVEEGGVEGLSGCWGVEGVELFYRA